MQKNNENWNNIFAFLYDIFLFLFDIIWNTKLPMTDISIAYWLVFWMVIKLAIYAVNGTSTKFNSLTSQTLTTTSNYYSSVVSNFKNELQKTNIGYVNSAKIPTKDNTPNRKSLPINKK